MWEHLGQAAAITQIKGIEDSSPWTTLKVALVLVSGVFEMWVNTNGNKSIPHFNVVES